MAAKKTTTSALNSRKQLLVAESELNRLEMLNEIRAIKADLAHLKQQMQAAGSLATSAAKVAVAVSAFRRIFFHRPKETEEPKRSSWISTLMRGVQMGTSLWGTLQSVKKQ